MDEVTKQEEEKVEEEAIDTAMERAVRSLTRLQNGLRNKPEI